MTDKNIVNIQTLKIDQFSKTDLALYNGRKVIIRTFNNGGVFSRIVARWLAKREKNILEKLNVLQNDNFPKLVYSDKYMLIRSYLEGKALVDSGKQDPAFFQEALKLVKLMHNINVVHNDLEKPENWIVQENKLPGIIDFQISTYIPPYMGSYFFKRLAHEDIRHILKNKDRYCTEPLTNEEDLIKNKKSSLNKLWRYGFKPIYNFITRKIFNYSDRNSSKYSK